MPRNSRTSRSSRPIPLETVLQSVIPEIRDEVRKQMNDGGYKAGDQIAYLEITMTTHSVAESYARVLNSTPTGERGWCVLAMKYPAEGKVALSVRSAMFHNVAVFAILGDLLGTAECDDLVPKGTRDAHIMTLAEDYSGPKPAIIVGADGKKFIRLI